MPAWAVLVGSEDGNSGDLSPRFGEYSSHVNSADPTQLPRGLERGGKISIRGDPERKEVEKRTEYGVFIQKNVFVLRHFWISRRG